MLRKTKKGEQLLHPNDRLKAKKAKSRPASKTINAKPVYNPEKSSWADKNEGEGFPTITGTEHAKRMSISREALVSGDLQVRGRLAILEARRGDRVQESQTIDGRIFLGARTSEAEAAEADAPDEPLTVSVRYENIYSGKELLALTESAAFKTAKLLESYQADAFDLGLDQGTNGTGGEFIQIMGGPFSKALYLYDYLEMHAKAFWLRNHHPLGAAAVRIFRSFAVGKGIKIMAVNQDVQKEIDSFSKRVKFPQILRGDVDTLVWAGEVFTHKTKDAAGLPELQQIDPSTIWEIVTDPANIKRVLYYHQQFPTQWQLVYKAGDKGSEYVINDIAANEVIHHKVNSTPGEKRGRSLLFPAMAWMKRYRDYLNAKVIKAQNEESTVLDITVDGSEADVQKIANDSGSTNAPRAGQVRVHNKDVEYNFLAPTNSSTNGRDTVADQLKSAVAVSLGLAPEWLGESSVGGNKATALVKENPASRTIEELQIVVEEYVREIIDWVLAEGIASGRIPATQTRKASLGKLRSAVAKFDWQSVLTEATGLLTREAVSEPIEQDYEIIFPEVQSEDRAAKLAAIEQAQACNYISRARAAEMTAKELGVTSFDYEQEKEAIRREEDEQLGNPEWGAAAGNKPPAPLPVLPVKPPALPQPTNGQPPKAAAPSFSGKGVKAAPEPGSAADKAAYRNAPSNKL